MMGEGKIVATWEAAPDAIELPARWAGALEHERIPFISYPYEWPFEMLRDAALLELECLVAALEEDIVLKDGSPFNVQWRGSRPVFIDVSSFRRLEAGEPWAGYRQFCQMFLYPLFVHAYRGVPFQPWLRGSIDGIRPGDCRKLLAARDLLRRGVFLHVWLQAKLQDRYRGNSAEVRENLKRAGFPKRAIEANAKGLRRVVAGIRPGAYQSSWSEYTGCRLHYAEADLDRKRVFVRRAVERRRWPLVWDLGCNTGEFSRIAAEHADTVVAMDSDPFAVDRLYRSLRGDGESRILPLVMDLADTSPSQGWRGRERRDLVARGRPDLTLCLALVHHLVIGANLPLDDLVDWLAELGGALVIEFPDRDDPMAAELLRAKNEPYADYDRSHFEELLSSRFDIVSREVLGGTRTLYFALPRGRCADGRAEIGANLPS